MKTEFTSTIKTTIVAAYIVPKGTKKAVARQFVLIGKLTDEQAEKAIEKQGKKQDFRLAYADSISYAEKLYPLSIALFTKYAVKLSRRGENGRTREALVTRTVQTTTVAAYVVPKGTKKPLQMNIVLDGFLTEDEAEKAVVKQGKKQGFRLAWIDGMTEDEAVFEMPARFFVLLSELYTKYGDDADKELEAYLADCKKQDSDSDSGDNADSDSDSDSDKA